MSGARGSATTIRAVRYHTYGGPDVLRVEDVPAPTAGAGQVVVDVIAAGVGGGEPGIRRGDLRRIMRQRLPAGTGVDFSGRVLELGQGVSGLKVGDAVWGLVPHGTFGAIAERIAVPATRVAHLPSNLDPIEAGALPANGTTALRALEGLRAGDRLLIRGAAGGVGLVAVQLGRAAGAHVSALASASDADRLHALGADLVLDHRTTTLDELDHYERIVDLVGTDLTRLRRRLVPGGSLYALALDMSHPVRTFATILTGSLGRRRIRAFSNDPNPAAFERLRQHVEDGHLSPTVHSTRPLSDIATAHKLLEGGGIRGKLLITPS